MTFFEFCTNQTFFMYILLLFSTLHLCYSDALDGFPRADYSDDDDMRRIPSYPGLQYDAPVQQIVDVENTLSELNFSPSYVPSWIKQRLDLGQVSAVSLDALENVVIFHRADRKWDSNSFRKDETFQQQELGPIRQSTIIVLNSTTGEVVTEWGQNLFYMPHGLTIDFANNVWITDVALHQVMKFLPNGLQGRPQLTLGEKFKPGIGPNTFCKPSAVAVMKSGDFFVADGYCNSRIVKFSMNGEFIMDWGRSTHVGDTKPPPYSFRIPHALALAEEKDMLCAADRENGRVQCFSATNGSYIEKFQHPLIGQRLFSVAYSPVNGGQLYIINGPNWLPYVNPVRGFVISMTSGKILSQFRAGNKDFSNPHDIAVSRDGRQLYVVEIDPYVVHKFEDTTLPMVANTSEIQMNVIESAKPTATVDKQLSVVSVMTFSDAVSIAKSPMATFLIIVTALIVLTAVLLGIAALISRHLKRGRRNRRRVWDLPSNSSAAVKFSHLMERRSRSRDGFEKVNTEESDDEATPATSMLVSPQFA